MDVRLASNPVFVLFFVFSPFGRMYGMWDLSFLIRA